MHALTHAPSPQSHTRGLLVLLPDGRMVGAVAAAAVAAEEPLRVPRCDSYARDGPAPPSPMARRRHGRGDFARGAVGAAVPPAAQLSGTVLQHW